MTNFDEMWTAIESLQSIADESGFADEWHIMCTERTPGAATAAAWAADAAYTEGRPVHAAHEVWCRLASKAAEAAAYAVANVAIAAGAAKRAATLEPEPEKTGLIMSGGVVIAECTHETLEY